MKSSAVFYLFTQTAMFSLFFTYKKFAAFIIVSFIAVLFFSKPQHLRAANFEKEKSFSQHSLMPMKGYEQAFGVVYPYYFLHQPASDLSKDYGDFLRPEYILEPFAVFISPEGKILNQPVLNNKEIKNSLKNSRFYPFNPIEYLEKEDSTMKNKNSYYFNNIAPISRPNKSPKCCERY